MPVLRFPVSKSKPNPAFPAALPFEDALAQIEQIIERIESGEVGLEQSLAEYERGVGLINHCRSKLDAARQQVEDLTRKLQQADEGTSPDGSGDEADSEE
jgi:exodeoxyribonuclease VII small subunit